MKNENLTQAVLYGQGKKALKGEVGEHSDTEVRRKGLKRVVRNLGGGALAATVSTLALGHGVGGLLHFNSREAREDKAQAPKIYQAPNAAPAAAEGSGDSDATAGAASTAPDSEAAQPAAPTSTEVSTPVTTGSPEAQDPQAEPEAAQPAGTVPTQANPEAAPDTGGLPAGEAPDPSQPPTGGISSVK